MKKTPAFLLAALLTLGLASSPAPAEAAGPWGFVVYCQYSKDLKKIFAPKASAIPGAVAQCMADGGHPAGVTPLFLRHR